MKSDWDSTSEWAGTKESRSHPWKGFLAFYCYSHPLRYWMWPLTGFQRTDCSSSHASSHVTSRYERGITRNVGLYSTRSFLFQPLQSPSPKASVRKLGRVLLIAEKSEADIVESQGWYTAIPKTVGEGFCCTCMLHVACCTCMLHVAYQARNTFQKLAFFVFH